MLKRLVCLENNSPTELHIKIHSMHKTILEILQRGRLSHDLIIEPATEAQVNKRDSLHKTVVKHKVYRVKSSRMPHASKADVGKITTDH